MTTTPVSTSAPEAHGLSRRAGRGRGWHRGWRQALVDTVYIVTGFALAATWFALLVTLISTGLGMAVTLVGIPILAATMVIWTRIADTERWRARRFLGIESPVPVEISVELEARPQTALESTAYFVVAEALANASKHAAAKSISVRVWRYRDSLLVEVWDDGVGGAHLEPGGGLEGLTTRVATVDGHLSISSPGGGPTVVRAELPCGS